MPKLIAYNILFALGLILAVSLLSAVTLDLYNYCVSPLLNDSASLNEDGIYPKDTIKINGPAYSDKQAATRHFADFHQTKREFRSYVGWRRLPLSTDSINIDQFGFRTHKPNPKNSNTAKVIGFFGGSTIWGTGVGDQNTIPALTDDLSNDYSALNFGDTSFTSRNSLAALINAISSGTDLDYVVFYDGVNDAHYYCQSNLEFDRHLYGPAIRQAIAGSQIDSSNLFNVMLDPTAVLLRKFIRKSRSSEDEAPVDNLCNTTDDHAQAVAANLVQNWHLAQAVASSVGARFIAVLQPNSYYGRPNTAYIREHGLITDEEARSSNLVYDAVKHAMQKTPRSWFLDLSTILDGETAYFIDTCHLNAKGNLQIAKEILTFITKPQTTPPLDSQTHD